MQYGATVHVELFSFPQNNGMIIKTFYFASWLQLHPPNKASGDHRQVIKSGVWTKVHYVAHGLWLATFTKLQCHELHSTCADLHNTDLVPFESDSAVSTSGAAGQR